MHRSWTDRALLVALVAMIGILETGCRRRSEQAVLRHPEVTAAPAPEPEPMARSLDGEMAEVALTISAPEMVEVGEELTAKIRVENLGSAALSGLVVAVRFDSGLENEASSGPIEREVDVLGPHESRELSVQRKAIRPGAFGITVEVTRDCEVLASRWTMVTVPGTPDPDPQEPAQRKEPDLGEPLVDNVDSLERLHPSYPVWFDKETKSVVMVGAVCQRRVPLELFACLRGSKEHESVVVVPGKAFVIHAGLLATGAEPGGPARFDQVYMPPHGPEVEIVVIWKDEEGERHTARAQDWVRNTQTGKAMTSPWVFAGSRFYQDETMERPLYVADVEGDLICVSNFPSAVLDIPVQSTHTDAALMFDAFTERIPPRGTPVTLVLTPKLDGNDKTQEAAPSP